MAKKTIILTCPCCGKDYELPARQALKLLGSLVGKMNAGRTSPKKKETATENGKKGGRPINPNSKRQQMLAVKARQGTLLDN